MLQPAKILLAQTVTQYLRAPYIIWMPIAVTVAVALIMILGMIYALSGFLGRTELKTWVRVKIYDTLFSLFLIILFFALFTVYFGINPVPQYASLKLVPDACHNSQVRDLYMLASCDMNQFLFYTYNLNSFLWYAIIIAALVPTINVNTGALFEAIGPGLGVSFGISLSPVPVHVYVGQLIGILFLLFVANQLQLIILSAALLIFSTFMAIGLIARLFGVTRSFGGALIAFALGVGVLYPALVSITYGFIDYGIQTQASVQICAPPPPLPPLTCVGSLLEAEKWGGVIFSAVVIPFVVLSGFVPVVGTTAQDLFVGFLKVLVIYGSLVSLGMTLIPFLNFLIVDTFIIDFSRAFGEKMDLLSLLGSLV